MDETMPVDEIDETAAQETAAQETAAQETAAQETAAQETAAQETAAQAGDADGGAPDDDDRTRSAWVHGHPEHYSYYDAEFGRIPDADPPCFEAVLLACLWRDHARTDALDQRMDLYEATSEWDAETFGALDDGDLGAVTARGGVLASESLVKWLRDVAAACAETGREYKGLRDYILAVRWYEPEERMAEMCARFPGFEREDAARLQQILGMVDDFSSDRDSWRYPSRRG